MNIVTLVDQDKPSRIMGFACGVCGFIHQAETIAHICCRCAICRKQTRSGMEPPRLRANDEWEYCSECQPMADQRHEIDDQLAGSELLDYVAVATALPLANNDWDHTSEECGGLASVFCSGWVDKEWFRRASWAYAWDEYYNYNEEDFDEEDNVGEDNPPPYWGKPPIGREGFHHQPRAIRHVYLRRVPWSEIAAEDDLAFDWHLDIADKPRQGEEGWFKATYMDL